MFPFAGAEGEEVASWVEAACLTWEGVDPLEGVEDTIPTTQQAEERGVVEEGGRRRGGSGAAEAGRRRRATSMLTIEIEEGTGGFEDVEGVKCDEGSRSSCSEVLYPPIDLSTAVLCVIL